MSGRGRGRGGRGGSSKGFNKEQLTALGVGGGEVVPGPVTQPPALYPPLERKPVPLVVSRPGDHALRGKNVFVLAVQGTGLPAAFEARVHRAHAAVSGFPEGARRPEAAG